MSKLLHYETSAELDDVIKRIHFWGTPEENETLYCLSAIQFEQPDGSTVTGYLSNEAAEILLHDFACREVDGAKVDNPDESQHGFCLQSDGNNVALIDRSCLLQKPDGQIVPCEIPLGEKEQKQFMFKAREAAGGEKTQAMILPELYDVIDAVMESGSKFRSEREIENWIDGIGESEMRHSETVARIAAKAYNLPEKVFDKKPLEIG